MKKITVITLLAACAFQAIGQSPLKLRDTTIKGPQTFAIIVGISKYKYIRPLTYADKDAELFRDYLRSPGGGSLKDDNIFCLLNDQASNSNFWGKGFQWLKAKQLRKGDRLFIYLAGHGDAIDEDQFFFLGYDCKPDGDKNNYLISGAIQLYNLKKKIANETTKGVEVFFIMDACRSNELPGGLAGQNFLNAAVSEKKAGEIIMLATAAGEESLEDASIGTGHGLFTYYLVDGLSGVADSIGQPDNKITFREIRNYVDKNVPSVALQRFKKKQDPYFCCTENSERVISNVDPAYLQKWLQIKKQQNRGGGNSFDGWMEKPALSAADTVLIETYNLFYKAVKSNKMTGPSSAEEYFSQLNKKFPGNPYTLDAKSTLSIEYINVAQARVDRYIGCIVDASAKEKQANYEAGVNLGKAIDLVREDDADFANSLYNRMYLLKANGDFGKDGKNGDISIAFQNGYAALIIDPNGAYIMNKLALLHLANNQADSALYYADKAAKTAPNWACALTTLALVQKTMSSSKQQPKKSVGRSSFGFTFGGGITRPKANFVENPNTNVVAVDSKSAGILDIGFLYHVNIGQNISLRPTVILIFGNTELFYFRRSTNGAIIRELVSIKNTSLNASLPLVIRFKGKTATPYIAVGPSLSYVLGQDDASTQQLPLKKTLLAADAGVGLDFRIPKTGVVISPELKFSAGISNMKDNAGNTVYSNTISSLKKQTFTLNVYLRKR